MKAKSYGGCETKSYNSRTNIVKDLNSFSMTKNEAFFIIILLKSITCCISYLHTYIQPQKQNKKSHVSFENHSQMDPSCFFVTISRNFIK
jgi:hypothetical protein